MVYHLIDFLADLHVQGSANPLKLRVTELSGGTGGSDDLQVYRKPTRALEVSREGNCLG